MWDYKALLGCPGFFGKAFLEHWKGRLRVD